MDPLAKRILVVEDHTDTASALSRLLSLAGYQVNTANGVRAALALCRADDFDLVISDIGLPDGTGYDLMRSLRHRMKGIAISGYGMEDDLERSRDAGFIEHLTKPVSLDKLHTVIRQVILSPLIMPAPLASTPMEPAS